MRRLPAVVLTATLLLVGCGDGGPSRADAVGALTETAVPARYAALAEQAGALPAEVDAWCSAREASTSDAIDGLVVAVRDDWQALAPFWSGPVMERRSRFLIDPVVTPDAVAELVASDQAVDADSLRDLAGADQRGLGALAVLVDGEPTERTCEYATGVAAIVADETAALAAAWVDFGPTLATDDATANMALRDTVSDALSAVRIVKDDPEASGNDGRVAGVRWLLLGDGDAPGLAPLLSDETVAQLTAELDAGAANEYERTIASSVVGELGTTVNFSDADGDG